MTREGLPMPDLDELKRAGKAARFALFLEGWPRPGKSRTRPRTPEKEALLVQRALARIRQGHPVCRIDENGARVLHLSLFPEVS